MRLFRLLPQFQDFLVSRKLVPEKNVPFYANWVSKFLDFVSKSNSVDQDGLVGEFLSSLESQKNVADWQVRQAEEALRLYLSHFGGGKTLKELRGSARSAARLADFPRLLDGLRDMKNAPQSPLDTLYDHK